MFVAIQSSLTSQKIYFFLLVAKEVLKIKDKLPIIEEEIADTWIHGIASDPSLQR